MTTAAERLRGAARGFGFDAAVRVLMHLAGVSDPAVAARFATPPHLAYPGAEVLAVEGGESGRPVVLNAVMGLVGPAGVLPRGYTELVTLAERERSPSLHAFLDMLADRFVAQFAGAGAKYRPHRAAEQALLGGGADPVREALLAFVGYAGNGDLAARLGCGTAPLLHYAGFFAVRPRSADRLAAMASDWLGAAVDVRQFVGTWLAVPPDQRSGLPRGRGEGSFCRLGVDAAIGVRFWDVQARVMLRVGPLDQAGFARLLPGAGVLGPLVALVRAYLGFETGFAVNLILRRDAVPPLCMADGPLAPRLGWNTWLTAPAGSRLRDPADPVFDADVVEAEVSRAAS